MSESIKVDKEWVIVGCSGKEFLGRPVPEPPTADEILGDEPAEDDGAISLCPAYALKELVIPGPQGVQFSLQALPAGFFCDSVVVDLSPDYVIRLDNLSEGDRRMVVEWVRGAEDARARTRASRARIAVPSH